MNIIQIRLLNDATGASLDDLITTQAFLRVLQDKIVEIGHDVPEHVSESDRVCTMELDERLRGDLLARKKLLQAQLEGYKTVGEKKAGALQELADVEARLGNTQKAQSATKTKR